MKTLKRSWRLAKISFGVIQDDPKLMILPIFALLSSAVLVVAFVLPALLFDAPSEDIEQIVFYATAFAIYFGLAFVATFFNTCVVHMTRGHFEGERVTIGASLRFAVSRIRVVLVWSLVAASVGVLFRLFEYLAERAGPIGRVVIRIGHAVFGVTWSLVTLFGVPAIVYHDVGPIQAIRHAAKLLERTWGDGLLLQFGLGFFQCVMVVAGIGVVFALMVIATDTRVLWVLLGLAVVYLVTVTSVFHLAGTIFGTALFVYADTGALPTGYSEDLLDDAIRSRW